MKVRAIKDILASYEVKPSARCWEILSSRLDAIMPQGQTSATQSAHQLPVGHGTAHIFGTAATKLVIALTVATVVTAATVIAVVNLTRPKTPAPAQPDTPSVIQTDTTVVNGKDTATIAPVVPANTHTTQTAHMPDSHKEASVENLQDVSPSIPVTTDSDSKVPDVAVMAGSQWESSDTVSTTAVPKRTPAVSNTGNATHPDAVKQDAQDDPVLQNLPEDVLNFTPPVKIEIPNVFTPNGDGRNDYFVINGLENCSTRRLTIRNKSGHVVYKSEFYENTWSGDGCPDGIYRYQFIFNNGNIDQSIDGNIYILRR